jgi:hypothetical protein
MTDEEQEPVPEEPSSKVQEMAELVKRLCMALTNVEMFGVDHPVGNKGIETASEWLAQMFERREEPVVISVSGKTIILDGVPLEERNPLVAKLASRLDDVHVSNLFLDPEITADEFTSFFRILGQGPKAVNAGGGLVKMLEDEGVTHIAMKEISYIMVTGDEKVVSKDATVVDGSGVSGLDDDSEIVKYMVWKVLQKADE